jgi:glycosyltransferase involved in cell wall biosynthesis
MRVGVITPRQPPTVGGGFTFHATVLDALPRVRTGHEFVPLFVPLDSGSAGGRAQQSQGEPPIDVQALFPSLAASLDSAQLMELAARKLALDVVWYLDPLAEALSVPVFATVLDLAHRQHPFFPEVSHAGWDWESRESHYGRVLPRAARIFTGTQPGKEEIVRCYGVNPANIVVNPFPTPALARAAEPIADDEVLGRHALKPGFLFYPAQFWPHKNHVNLLLALKQLESEYGLMPDLVLTGADKGNLTHVRRIAGELGLQQRVHFLGFVPGSEVVALYRCAAALVFPSFFGPDNLPQLEAFSLGCPVLTGRIDGSGSHGQLGSDVAAFFDPARPDEMAAQIARVLRDISYRAALIENGRALAAARTPEAYVEVILRTLDEFEPWRRTWPVAAMQIQSVVARFPADLADVTPLHSGVYGDGWLAGRAFLVLSAPPESWRLTIRGEVPLVGDAGFSTTLSISVDRRLLAQPELSAGKFEVSVGEPGLLGPLRVDFSFNNLQRLPDPDGRMVGARIDFIGFGDPGETQLEHSPV